MRYIHELSTWPKLTINLEEINTILGNARYTQGLFLGRLQSLGFDIQQDATLETLTSDIVKSSEIEGENLNPEEVRSSIAHQLGINAKKFVAPSRHVEGIVKMMLDATQNYQNILTEERICTWHFDLFESSPAIMTIGAYRSTQEPMEVISGAYGRKKVHFTAPASNKVPDEMAIFLDWFNHSDSIDPYIKAAMAHFWFVTIHPLEDGNGRIARAIADMCLARADKTKQRFYSMSYQLRKERSDYYKQLELAQKGTLDITSWVKWFLECLSRALASADITLDKILHKAEIWGKLNHYSINERQRKIINKLFDNFEGKLTTSKYAKITKCSEDTALRDIKKLINYGVLYQSEGVTKKSSYLVVSRKGM
ncbi:Fic family protein [Piscirickettsia salmonis]|uniref:Fic family protein n=1 Tax=Piscirickettsia salmonis TaxID=1238 RepID=UPI003EBECCEE